MFINENENVNKTLRQKAYKTPRAITTPSVPNRLMEISNYMIKDKDKDKDRKQCSMSHQNHGRHSLGGGIFDIVMIRRKRKY